MHVYVRPAAMFSLISAYAFLEFRQNKKGKIYSVSYTTSSSSERAVERQVARTVASMERLLTALCPVPAAHAQPVRRRSLHLRVSPHPSSARRASDAPAPVRLGRAKRRGTPWAYQVTIGRWSLAAS